MIERELSKAWSLGFVPCVCSEAHGLVTGSHAQIEHAVIHSSDTMGAAQSSVVSNETGGILTVRQRSNQDVDRQTFESLPKVKLRARTFRDAIWDGLTADATMASAGKVLDPQLAAAVHSGLADWLAEVDATISAQQRAVHRHIGQTEDCIEDALARCDKCSAQLVSVAGEVPTASDLEDMIAALETRVADIQVTAAALQRKMQDADDAAGLPTSTPARSA